MTTYHTVSMDGLDIFYREAGSRDHPTILLLHDFPRKLCESFLQGNEFDS